MPRKSKLSTRQSAIMTMLSEAGSEAFDTIIPTIESQDLDGLERDIVALRNLGLVDFYADRGTPETRFTVMTEEEIGEFPSFRDVYLQEASRVHGLLLTKRGEQSLTI